MSDHCRNYGNFDAATIHADGEAVVLGVDGVADFDALHSWKHDEEVQLYAFDILALDGDDLRRLPLSLRKTNLARLRAAAGRYLCRAVRTGRNRPRTLPRRLRHGAGGTGIEAVGPAYQAGRSKHWVKVKNRRHQAMRRVMEAFA